MKIWRWTSAVLGLLTVFLVAPVVAQPIPAAILNLPAETRIGEDFTFTVAFDNASPTDPGFGPFIDIIFPVNGADGAAGSDTADGIDFVGATYLGVTVESFELTFPGPGPVGCVAHPLAVDVVNIPLQVCGTTGDLLVVLRLPFGSFTSDQPPAEMEINTNVSNLADLSVPLTFYTRAGFHFGADPLDNPAVDPSILSDVDSDSGNWTVTAAITPTLLDLQKIYIGPEDETATGPNFPRQYTIIIDIADGQTITDFDITDRLPNNLAFLSVDSIVPAGAIVTTPPIGVAANPPNNEVVINIPTVTGTVATNDVEVTFSFFVPLNDANGDPVLNAQTGDDEISENEALAVGDWDPIDLRDLGGIDNAVADPVGFEHELEDQSNAIQKGVAVAIGGPEVNPGDTLEYTLEIQISDFFAFEALIINDILSDGQRFDTTFTPTFSLTVHGAPTAGPFAPANFTVIDHFTGGAPPVAPIDGTQEIEFRLSDELVTRALAAQVLGGCVPLGGTGGPPPDCGLFNGGGTVGSITYRAIIQEDYTDDFPSGDSSVDHGDVLNNTVVIAGDVLSVTDGVTPTGFSEDDDSGAGVAIERGALAKTVYAVNGITPPPHYCSGGVNQGNLCNDNGDCPGAVCSVEISPGTTLTYRLRYTLPSSDAEQLYLDDFLPLPIFYSTEVATFNDVLSAVPPAAGEAQFGPVDTFRALSGIVPVLSSDAVANSLRFFYGDYDDPANTPTEIDILFTVTASADPFADRLFLTNQARASESNTQIEAQVEDAIVQVILAQPNLNITKGVVSTDSVSGVFSPAIVAPQPISLPGSGCPRFPGVIHSSGLAVNPVDSNLAGAQATDVVTYAIVIENVGSSSEGAYDVRFFDTPAPNMFPTGFGVGGINLCVTDGTGAPIAFTDLGGGLFGSGLELDDPGPTPFPPGSLDRYQPTTGQNLVIITYDMVVGPGVQPDGVEVNNATLFNYAGLEGGPDHTVTDREDPATVTMLGVAPVEKSLVSTSEAHTATAPVEPLAIGEIARFRLEIGIPQGALPSLEIEDLLPTGLTFLNDGTATVAFVSNGAGITSTTLAGPGLAVAGNEGNVSSIVPTFVLPGGAIAGGPFVSGTNPTFLIGNVQNSDDDADLEFVVIEFNALADNSALGSNDAGDTRQNRFRVRVDGLQSGADSNAVTVRIVEPSITNLDKSPSAPIIDAGDDVTYTVTYSNAVGANVTTAFNVVLSDTLPADLILDVGSVNIVLGGGAAGATDGTAGNTVTVTVDSVPAGGSVTVTYTAQVVNAVLPETVINNTAAVVYTSLPGTNGTVVNPTGSSTPGAPGTNTGERDGSGGINDYADTDPASITVQAVAPVKSITATSEAHTGVVDGVERVAIGEIVRYRLQTRIPESIMPDFRLVDALPTGLTFLNDGTATVAFVGNNAGITSSTLGAAPFIAGNEATVSAITPVFVLPGGAISGGPFSSGTDPSFLLGTLSNLDNDADQEFVVIEFNALVDNTIGGSNDAGDNRNNTFRVRINGANSGPNSNSVQVRVREPSITNLDKVANPTSGDAGDTIAYTITYSNAAGANVTTAFDVALVDVLPADLTLDLGSVNVVLGGGAAGVNDNSAGNAVDIVIDSVPPSGTVTITYDATLNVSVEPNQSIVNTADLTYTSLPGPNGTIGNPTGSDTPGASGSGTGERDGSGGINDYVDSDNASLSVPEPAVSKELTATTEAATDPGDLNLATNPPVAIGEVLTYRLVFEIIEGTTQGVTLVDLVPDGLVLVPGSATLDRSSVELVASVDPGAINANVPGVPVPVVLDDATPGQLRLELGTVVNTDTDNVTTETYILELQMVVANIASNNAGTLLENTGRIEFLDADNVPVGLNTGTIEVHVAEPIVEISKTVDAPIKTGGDIVTFEIVVSNTAAGPNAASGFQWVFTDTLPVEYLAPMVVSIDTGVTGAVVTASFTGNTLNGTIDQLDPGESITVTYEATIDPGVFFGQMIPNSVFVDATSLSDGLCAGGANNGLRCIDDLECPGGTCAYGSPGAPGSPTGERTGSGVVNDLFASDNALVTIDGPSLTKTNLTPLSYHPVGATATFQISSGVPIGSQTGFIYTDVLPVGLSYVPGSLVVVSPPLTSSTCGMPNPPCDDTNPAFFQLAGNTMTFDFGDITVLAAGAITLTYDVTVDNILSNQDGVLLLNTVQLEFDDQDSPGDVILTGPVDNDIPVRVGEPDLEVEKTITAGAVGSDAGDTVSWRVDIGNFGNTTAYQLDWSDTLPDGLNQISAVVVTVLGGNVYLNGTVTPVVSGDAIVSTTLNANDTVSLPLLEVEPGATLRITFNSVVMNTVTPGQLLTNNTAANYTSLVGGGRDNSTDPGNVDDDDDSDLNNYEESATQSLTIASTIAVDKTVSPATYTIGEDVTYAIRVDIIEGTTQSVVLTDILPVGLTYQSHLISVGVAGMTFSNPGYNTRLGAGQTVVFDFGDVLNPADNNAANNFFTIALTARVNNDVSNQNGVVRRNGQHGDGSELYIEYGPGATRVDFDADGVTPGIQGVVINIVEPVLGITKSVAPNKGYPGQEVTFTVNVSHLAGSTATAYNVAVTDTLPVGMTYVPGSASLPAVDVAVAGQVLTFNLNTITLMDAGRTFTFRASIDGGVTPGTFLVNQVSTQWRSLPGSTGAPLSGRTGADGAGGALNDYASSGSASLQTTGPDLNLTKSHVGAFTVGQQGTFTLNVKNQGPAPTVGLITLTDNLPVGLTYVSAAGPGWTCGNVGQAVTCTHPGPFAPNASSAITLIVLVGEAAYPTVNNVASVNTANDTSLNNNSDSDAVVVRAGTPTPLPTATPTQSGGGLSTPTAVAASPTSTLPAPTSTPPPTSTIPPTATPTPFIDVALVKHSLLNFKTCSVGSFEYRVRNMGTGTRGTTVGPITIVDSLHPSLTFVSFAGQGWTCAPVGSQVHCEYPAPLAPNALTVVTVSVYVDESAFPTITTSAEVSTPFDGNAQNNFEWVATTVSHGDCTGAPTPTAGAASPTPTVVGTALPTSTPMPTPTPDPSGCDLGVSTRYVGIPRPGGNLEFRLTWSHSCRDALDLDAFHTIPTGMELLSVDVRDGDVVTTDGLVSIHQNSRSAGVQSAVLRLRILPTVTPGGVLCANAMVEDSLGRQRHGEACLNILGGTESLRTALHAHLLTRPGRQLSYTARYFGVRPENRLVMELPERATILDIQPPLPDEIDGRILTWHNLPAVSGKVRYTLQVDYDAPPGTILATAMDFMDTFGREFRQHETLIVAESAPSGQTTIGQLVIVGPRSLRPGQITDLSVRYRKVADAGALVMNLAPGYRVISATPEATVDVDGSLRWQIGGSPTAPVSGAVKVKVQVDESMPPGSILASYASLTTTSAAADAENLVVVKNVQGNNKSSSAISAPRRVIPGMQTQLGIKVRKVPGPVVVELTLPPQMVPVLTIPAATITASGKLSWNVGGSAGELVSFQPKVKVAVLPSTTPADLLSATATVSSPFGTLVSSAVMEVRPSNSSAGGTVGQSLALSGSTRIAAGAQTTLKAKYRGLPTFGQLELHLPPALGSVVSTIPAAQTAPDGRLVWTNLPPGSGGVSVKVTLHPGAPSGQVMSVVGVLTDADSNATEATFATAVR